MGERDEGEKAISYFSSRSTPRGLLQRFNLKKILTRDVVPFIAGAIFAKLTEVLLGEGPEIVDRIALAIALILSLLMIALYTVLVANNAELVESRTYSVFVNQDEVVDGSIKKTAFSACIAAAMGAKRSIIVMGPNFEKGDANRDNGAESSSHDLYLEEGMSAAMERHIRNRGSDFRYQRVVQIDDESLNLVDREGECPSYIFQNDALAHHVQRMIKKSKETHTAEIGVVAMPAVPSFPSTLVVDDRYVFFSLPTAISMSEKAIDGDLNMDSIRYDVVLGIEDASGDIPRMFRQIILQFGRLGQEIKGVKFGRPSVSAG